MWCARARLCVLLALPCVCVCVCVCVCDFTMYYLQGEINFGILLPKSERES